MTNGNGKSYLTRDNDSACSVFCSQIFPGETKQILGFNALHAVNSHKITAASGSVDEDAEDQWVATALDCFPLVDENHSLTDGKETAFEIKTVTAAVTGDPPADKFILPTDYTEVPPSSSGPPPASVTHPRNGQTSDKMSTASPTVEGNKSFESANGTDH